MNPYGSVRGWNSKTWRNADWGFSIWNFNGINILNHSASTNEIFYLSVFDIDNSRHKIKLSVQGKNSTIESTNTTTSLKNAESGASAMTFHLSIKEAERNFLEPAEGLEEGYKRLSIHIELIN